MRSMLKLVGAFALGSAAGIAAGCQNYDFEPVTPLALAQTTQTAEVKGKNFKPNLIILLDKSGSMAPPGGPSPSRWDQVKASMQTFLTDPASRSVARLGLFSYAKDNYCAAPTLDDIRVPIPDNVTSDADADLKPTADAILSSINAIQTGGGTPTGASLRTVGNYPGLNDPNDQRQDFVLLLTDGLPNCNSALNGQLTSCRCTAANISQGTSSNPCPQDQCLDRDGAVAAVRELALKGIKTIVVGFGADTATGDGPETLNAMAEAGGFARGCPNGTNAECGAGGTCNQANKLCDKKFFQAQTQTELAQALAAISAGIGREACEYVLDSAPSDPRFLAVIVDGQSLQPGTDTYNFESPNRVTFVGGTCSKLQNSTPASPVNVEFRIVEGL